MRQVQLSLEQHHTHSNTTLSCGHRVLRSGGPNHINPCVLLAQAYESLSPSNNELQWDALLVVRWKCRKSILTFEAPGRSFFLFTFGF
jgi:hypothetical protein